MRLKLICAFCFFLISHYLAAEHISVLELFAGYLANDIETQRQAAEMEKQILASQITSINNGFDIQVSTGTINFRTGNNASVKFTPSATVKFPELQNLSAGVNSTVEIRKDKTVGSVSLNVGIDIFSNAKETRNITLLRSERNVLESKRALQNRALNAERDFYNNLQSLYSLASLMVLAQKDLYDHSIEFDRIKLQGYNPLSSQYRTADMKVRSDEHTVELYRRRLETETAIFASLCGVNYDGDDALGFLPNDIPRVEAVDILSFDKAKFTEIENAEWNHYINDLARKADKNYSLSVNGGFTFDNVNTNSHTIDVGASASYKGVKVAAGMNIPVVANTNPSYTLGMSFSPNAFITRSLEDKQNVLTQEQEMLAITKAERNYNTTVLAVQRDLADIEWSHSSSKEYYDMYDTLEKDLAKWFEAGVISGSEYRNAQVNKERYRIQQITNDIELILYNDATKLLFCRDEEIK